MSDKGIIEREVLEVLHEQYDIVFSAEKKVVDFVLKNPQKAVDSNVSELALASGVSDATVVRMCHHLGYSGYYQFRLTLARDLGKKQYPQNVYSQQDDAIGKMFGEYAEAMIMVGKQLDAGIMWKCVDVLKNSHCIHLIAVGNTSNLTQYMGFRLERLGIKSTYSMLPEYFINHINLADGQDAVVAISKSGASKKVIKGMELAKEKGMKLIAITAALESPVSELADYVLASKEKQELFNVYRKYSYLNEVAIIDALLSLVVNEELIRQTEAEKPEILLSENKL